MQYARQTLLVLIYLHKIAKLSKVSSAFNFVNIDFDELMTLKVASAAITLIKIYKNLKTFFTIFKNFIYDFIYDFINDFIHDFITILFTILKFDLFMTAFGGQN